MKIRIGVGLGTQTDLGHREGYAGFVDTLEGLGFDSLWVSERVQGPALDPVVAMTFAAARTTRLKIGTSVMVLPGRNPVLLAKALASVDVVSNGRLLPAFGLGVVNAAEHQAFGVQRGDRAPWFDEALPLLHRLWTEDAVVHHGERFHLDGVTVSPKPVQDHLDVWLGGVAPSELRRTARLGDGWLPSFCTPAQVGEGIRQINEAAASHGRRIDPDHFGVLVGYLDGDLPARFAQTIAVRNPGVDPADLVVVGRDHLRERIEAFCEVGASKFVLTRLDTLDDWDEELRWLARHVLPLEN